MTNETLIKLLNSPVDEDRIIGLEHLLHTYSDWGGKLEKLVGFPISEQLYASLIKVLTLRIQKDVN